MSKTIVLPPDEIVDLAEKREAARRAKDWDAADKIRGELESQGWTIQDNPDGYLIEKKD